ncbi:MAG: response regulator [Pseudomonadota bacterium]
MKRILIADDNEINREFLKAALARENLTVCEARDGREAVEQYREAPFDLILMDIRMPEMDGIAAAGAIREAEKALNVRARIVALTADLQLSATTDLLKRGFDDCLAKPVTRRTLLKLINGEPQTGEHAVVENVIDRPAALAAAGGSEELLDRLLAMLAQELKNFLPDIEAAIGQQQWDQARGPVHKLRGSAGYTGCVQLQAAAAKLELALTREMEAEVQEGWRDLKKAAETLAPLIGG